MSASVGRADSRSSAFPLPKIDTVNTRSSYRPAHRRLDVPVPQFAENRDGILRPRPYTFLVHYQGGRPHSPRSSKLRAAVESTDSLCHRSRYGRLSASSASSSKHLGPSRVHFFRHAPATIAAVVRRRYSTRLCAAWPTLLIPPCDRLIGPTGYHPNRATLYRRLAGKARQIVFAYGLTTRFRPTPRGRHRCRYSAQYRLLSTSTRTIWKHFTVRPYRFLRHTWACLGDDDDPSDLLFAPTPRTNISRVSLVTLPTRSCKDLERGSTTSRLQCSHTDTPHALIQSTITGTHRYSARPQTSRSGEWPLYTRSSDLGGSFPALCVASISLDVRSEPGSSGSTVTCPEINVSFQTRITSRKSKSHPVR